jgi:hypothetical protein
MKAALSLDPEVTVHRKDLELLLTTVWLREQQKKGG